MEDASFGGATFTQYVDFTNTAFTQFTDFKGAKLMEAAEFRETKFRGHDKGKKDRADALIPGPTFSLAEFSHPEKVRFYKTYLGQAVFYNCDVSRLVFSSVQWRERKGSGKRMVLEEVVALDHESDLKVKEGSPDEREYALIAELYQQLKKNYDDKRDYWTAGDFHYGELEMKRLHSKRRNHFARWSHKNLGLVAWYKYASEYGESYVRPVVVLMVILAVFTFLFPLAGLDSNGNAPRPPVSYSHFSDFVNGYHGQKWFGRTAFFGHSLMTTLSVAGFQRELKYEPSYPWGRALALLELLLTSTLISLFLLAVRRQFKR